MEKGFSYPRERAVRKVYIPIRHNNLSSLRFAKLGWIPKDTRNNIYQIIQVETEKMKGMKEEKTSPLQGLYEIMRGVDGWLACEEGVLLWYLARSGSGRGAVVEIGSWKGKSTIWLAWSSKSIRREKIVAIDPHRGSNEHKRMYGKIWTYNEFLQNLRLAGVFDWVTPIVSTSREVAQGWTGDLRLVFIDGSHEYEDVRDDFCLWFGLLGSDGIIALHDSYFSLKGPTRVVERFLLRNAFATHVGFVGSITFCQKGKPSGFHHARNAFLAQAFQLLRGVANIGKPRLAFWLSFLLNATDIKSIGLTLLVYWQAVKLVLRGRGALGLLKALAVCQEN